MRGVVVMVAMIEVIAGCGSPTANPSSTPVTDPAVAALPPAPYYDVLWVSEDRIAAASYSTVLGSKLEVFDSNMTKVGDVSLDDSETCNVRTAGALSRMPNGSFSFAVACERPPGLEPFRVGHVYAVDPLTLERTELRQPVGVPGRMAWSPDGTELTYQVGLALCSTLYRQTATHDGPLGVSATIGGETVRLGEDVTSEPGACVGTAQTIWPVINADGTLAALAEPTLDRSGQSKGDLPWSLVVVKNGVATAVLDGLVNAFCLAWTPDGDLVFSAALSPGALVPDGLYRVHADGTGLTKVGSRALASCSVSPDGSSIIGTDGGLFPPRREASDPVTILSYPLGSDS